MTKIIKLVADVEKSSPKPRVMEYRYMLFTVSQDGVVTRVVGAYRTEHECNDYIKTNSDPENYRIVDLNGILNAW